MSIPPWDLSEVRNAEHFCFEEIHPDDYDLTEEELTDAGWQEVDFGTYRRMNPKTEGIIRSASFVHLNNIRKGNVDEWAYRLNLLFDSGLAFMSMCGHPDGDVPIRIRIQDINVHRGLILRDIQRWNNQEFDLSIRRYRTEKDPI